MGYDYDLEKRQKEAHGPNQMTGIYGWILSISLVAAFFLAAFIRVAGYFWWHDIQPFIVQVQHFFQGVLHFLGVQ